MELGGAKPALSENRGIQVMDLDKKSVLKVHLFFYVGVPAYEKTKAVSFFITWSAMRPSVGPGQSGKKKLRSDKL